MLSREIKISLGHGHGKADDIIVDQSTRAMIFVISVDFHDNSSFDRTAVPEQGTDIRSHDPGSVYTIYRVISMLIDLSHLNEIEHCGPRTSESEWMASLIPRRMFSRVTYISFVGIRDHKFV